MVVQRNPKDDLFSFSQFIGSSLLFIHDEERVGVWLIDFGKTVPLPEGVAIDHNSAWEVGNHEDGYKIGVDNLVALFSALVEELREEKREDNEKIEKERENKEKSEKEETEEVEEKEDNS